MLQKILTEYLQPFLLSLLLGVLTAMAAGIRSAVKRLPRLLLAWATKFEQEAAASASKLDDAGAALLLAFAKSLVEAFDATLGTRNTDHPAGDPNAIANANKKIWVSGQPIVDRRAPRGPTAGELLERRAEKTPAEGTRIGLGPKL